jgi:hypothetical protein
MLHNAHNGEQLWMRTKLNWASASGFLTGQGRVDKQDGRAMTTAESKKKKENRNESKESSKYK